MKKLNNKLQLNKETIARLNEEELSSVEGGGVSDVQFSTICMLTKWCYTIVNVTCLCVPNTKDIECGFV